MLYMQFIKKNIDTDATFSKVTIGVAGHFLFCVFNVALKSVTYM